MSVRARSVLKTRTARITTTSGRPLTKKSTKTPARDAPLAVSRRGHPAKPEEEPGRDRGQRQREVCGGDRGKPHPEDRRRQDDPGVRGKDIFPEVAKPVVQEGLLFGGELQLVGGLLDHRRRDHRPADDRQKPDDRGHQRDHPLRVAQEQPQRVHHLLDLPLSLHQLGEKDDHEDRHDDLDGLQRERRYGSRRGELPDPHGVHEAQGRRRDQQRKAEVELAPDEQDQQDRDEGKSEDTHRNSLLR